MHILAFLRHLVHLLSFCGLGLFCAITLKGARDGFNDERVFLFNEWIIRVFLKRLHFLSFVNSGQDKTLWHGVLCSSVCSMVGHWCAMVGWVWPMVGALCFYPLFWLAAGDCSNNNGTSHPLYLLLYVFVNNEKHNTYSWSPTIFCSALHCYLNLHYYGQLILTPIDATFLIWSGLLMFVWFSQRRDRNVQ